MILFTTITILTYAIRIDTQSQTDTMPVQYKCDSTNPENSFAVSNDVEAEYLSPYILYCCISSSGSFAGWYKGYEQVGMGNNDYYSNSQYAPRQQALIIRTINSQSVGIYTCLVNEPRGTIEISVNVKIIPSLKIIRNQFLTLYKNDRVWVQVMGLPIPTIKWTKGQSTTPLITSDNKLTTEAIDRYEIGPIGELIINNVNNDDSGRYIVSLYIGDLLKKEEVIEVSVGIAPSMVFVPQPQYNLTEDQYFELPCQITGTAPLQIKWNKYVNGEFQRTFTMADRGVITTSSTGSLVFQLPRPGDAGVYECQGSNYYGNISVLTEVLYVIQAARIINFNDAKVRLGKTATLVCVAEGKPSPDVSIWRNGQTIPNQINIPGSATINIENVLYSDSGSYECIADNYAIKKLKREYDSRIMRLYIDSAPFIDESKSTKKVIVTDDNKQASLRCVILGTPTPKIKLFFKKAEITDFKTEITFYTTILNYEISSVVDNLLGIYYCKAENLLGSTSYEMEIVKIDKPGKPKDIKILLLEPTTLILSWSEPLNNGGNNISLYNIKCEESTPLLIKKTFDIVPFTFGMNTRLLSIDINGLKPNKKYACMIKAYNSGYWGLSEVIMLSTPILGLPSQPRIISLDGMVNDIDYHLIWEPPLDVGDQSPSTFLRYSIDCCIVDEIVEGNFEKCRHYTDVYATRQWIVGLNANSRYKISLSAINTIGTSEKSFTYIITGVNRDNGLPWTWVRPTGLAASFLGASLFLFLLVDIMFCFNFNCGFTFALFRMLNNVTQSAKLINNNSLKTKKKSII